MTTAQDVFITAMNLMDEVTEDGAYTGYPDEYKTKAWPILTLLQAECLPASTTPTVISDETGVFILDERTIRTVLPYGLAAHLLMNEDQNRASFFNARYDELKRKRPAKIVKITDKYGVSEGTDTTDTTTPDTPTSDTTDIIDGGEV